MSFKENLESWLNEIQKTYQYSHIEKAFTHLYIRDFRDDHDFSEPDIRTHVVDNAYDLGIDAIYVNKDDELVLVQSKYSYNDTMLKPEMDKADKFLSNYFEVDGGHRDNLLKDANKALRSVLMQEVLPETIHEVRFVYLCGQFSPEIRSSLANLEAKYREGHKKEFYIDLTNIQSLEAIHDPYHVANESYINVIEEQFYQLKDQVIAIEAFPDKSIHTKACVFTAQAASLKKLYEQLGDALFEANVRNFLSFRKPINKAIKMEIEKASKSNLWFYNNGLVAICEGFDIAQGVITAKNLQIVNGGQTVRTISNAKYIDPHLGVNVKLISITNADQLDADVRKTFMNELAINSNRQNPINSRDLKANDLIQRELQKRFREYDWFLQIKAGEEKIESWKADLKKKGKSIVNTTLVGYFVSFYLQKTNASAGRNALAFLDEDEGDLIINYGAIFGSKGQVDTTFQKQLLSLFLAQKLDKYRNSEVIEQNFPFHFYSINVMLALIGYWIYLNENPSKRLLPYDEIEVREFLNSSSFDIKKYISIDSSKKHVELQNLKELDAVFEFFTEKIHDQLFSMQIHNQFKKIIALFKKEATVKNYADAFRPSLALKKLYLSL